MPQMMTVMEPGDSFVTVGVDGNARVWFVDERGTPMDPYDGTDPAAVGPGQRDG